MGLFLPEQCSLLFTNLTCVSFSNRGRCVQKPDIPEDVRMLTTKALKPFALFTKAGSRRPPDSILSALKDNAPASIACATVQPSSFHRYKTRSRFDSS